MSNKGQPMTNPGDLKLETRLSRMEEKLDVLVESVTILRIKAGFYGAATGGLFGLLAGAAVTYWLGGSE